MRRVLHLRTVTGHGGGPEKTLLASPPFLADAYHLRLVYLRPAGDPDYDMPQRAAQMNVELVDLPERGAADPRTIIRLVREIRRFRPHLLHAHDYKTDLLALMLGRVFRIPVVTTLHGYVTLGSRLQLYYRIGHLALRRMHHAIAVSPELYELLGELGVPDERRTYVENGIDVQHYQRRQWAREARAQLGFAPDRCLVGAVGRLQPEKGFDVLIAAAAELLRDGHPFDLVIAGDGPLRSSLAEQIARLGMVDHIRLLGHRTDVKCLFEALDVFALSSVREGLPNVLLEAMAMEAAVVATAVGAVPRVLQHHENGLLIPAQDQQALRDALASLVTDASLRERLRGAARRTVVEQFNFERRMQRIRAIYDHVLEASVQDASPHGVPCHYERPFPSS